MPRQPRPPSNRCSDDCHAISTVLYFSVAYSNGSLFQDVFISTLLDIRIRNMLRALVSFIGDFPQGGQPRRIVVMIMICRNCCNCSCRCLLFLCPFVTPCVDRSAGHSVRTKKMIMMMMMMTTMTMMMMNTGTVANIVYA